MRLGIAALVCAMLAATCAGGPIARTFGIAAVVDVVLDVALWGLYVR